MPLTSKRTTRAPATRTSPRTHHASGGGGIMSGLRSKPKAAPTKVHTQQSRNPVTGTTTTTTTTKHRTHGHAGGATTTRAPATHHRRKPTMGDKVSGALTKLAGSLTGRSGKKAAGTRRMHGTDGRGSRRV